MGEFADGKLKLRLVAEFEARVREELRRFRAPCRTPKVFTIPVDEATHAAELAFFESQANMLPEEYYLYLINKVVLSEVCEQASEEEADLLFLPMHVPVYSLCNVDFGRHLRDAGVLDSSKPKLFVYSWDTYPRPPFERANPFCPLGQRILDLSPLYAHADEWLDQSWHLAVTESTIDLHPNDFGMPAFTLPAERPSRLTGERLLYSFCGVLRYSLMSRDHVRGVDRYETWQRLAHESASDVFVGELEDARRRFGDVGFRDFTGHSTFTLCPAGWARWSFRLTEAILDGSIPVILSDYYELPFARWLPWSEFSLRLPEASLSKIDSILRQLPPAKLAALQRGVEKWRTAFTISGFAENLCRELGRVVLDGAE